MKALLLTWGTYLKDPESKRVLNTSETGWFSELGLAKLERNLAPLTFDQTYKSKPQAEYRGYTSWDNFFTRELQDGVRPVHHPEDKTLIHSACESTVYRIASKVKRHDQFWLKAQKYSLYDMLYRDDKMAHCFEGGTVYQAFLSPLEYHRWHSPIDGVIEDFLIIPGSYYAVLPDEGAPIGDPDFPAGSPYGALIRSQPYLAVVATRALIYIRADNTDIGLVCFMGVGMLEVSTCDITVNKKDHVNAGDEIGMFHFGGSTYTLIFEPKCNVAFRAEMPVNTFVKLNSIIGQVVPEDKDKDWNYISTSAHHW